MDARRVNEVYFSRWASGQTGCDRCGDWGPLEIHHIINKGRVVNNDLARERIDALPLLALLCKKCHDRAHNPKIATELLGLNIKRFGRKRVETAVKSVEQAMNVGQALGISLPEPDERSNDGEEESH